MPWFVLLPLFLLFSLEGSSALSLEHSLESSLEDEEFDPVTFQEYLDSIPEDPSAIGLIYLPGWRGMGRYEQARKKEYSNDFLDLMGVGESFRSFETGSSLALRLELSVQLERIKEMNAEALSANPYINVYLVMGQNTGGPYLSSRKRSRTGVWIYERIHFSKVLEDVLAVLNQQEAYYRLRILYIGNAQSIGERISDPGVPSQDIEDWHPLAQEAQRLYVEGKNNLVSIAATRTQFDPVSFDCIEKMIEESYILSLTRWDVYPNDPFKRALFSDNYFSFPFSEQPRPPVWDQYSRLSYGWRQDVVAESSFGHSTFFWLLGQGSLIDTFSEVYGDGLYSSRRDEEYRSYKILRKLFGVLDQNVNVLFLGDQKERLLKLFLKPELREKAVALYRALEDGDWNFIVQEARNYSDRYELFHDHSDRPGFEQMRAKELVKLTSAGLSLEILDYWELCLELSMRALVRFHEGKELQGFSSDDQDHIETTWLRSVGEELHYLGYENGKSDPEDLFNTTSFLSRGVRLVHTQLGQLTEENTKDFDRTEMDLLRASEVASFSYRIHELVRFHYRYLRGGDRPEEDIYAYTILQLNRPVVLKKLGVSLLD